MAKLSVIIPSRDEAFLTKTIDDIFRNARGEIEVVAVLDSDKWPLDWKEVTDRHPNLHTVHHGSPRGMRAAINSGIASAKSRGAKYILKSDGHCAFSEGFDEELKKSCEPDWIMVPRRGRLDPENWVETELSKPPIDYHYLSFPDDPNDFGGKGLNGKPWPQRAIERKDVMIDEEMSSQGSLWMAHLAYVEQLELMDEANYGGFWSEFQEIGLKCWLSGGKVMVNKNCKYLHLHKGTKYGRGYRLQESWLQQGASFTKNWIWNEAWDKQTKPFEWLIDHFWPVPSWPENWREVLYATRKPRTVVGATSSIIDSNSDVPGAVIDNGADSSAKSPSLKIHEAYYGIGQLDLSDALTFLDVTNRLQSLVRNDSLDIIVSNSTLTPEQNPFRGKKKRLTVKYSIDGGDVVTVEREEKDWLIIGPARQRDDATGDLTAEKVEAGLRQGILEPELIVTDEGLKEVAVYVKADMPPNPRVQSVASQPPLTPAALNDYLIRRFQISPQRLRGPMPIELRDFHRNDLAQLFAELGFKRGAEIGVAEGNYSEILLKANPECELLLVDPWHAYSDNPQNKSPEKNAYAYNETLRKIEPYLRARPIMKFSMDAVRDIKEGYLDFVYIDGHHSYPYVMCDIIEWTKRVRSGGIVALDDIYKLNEKWGAGPMEAIYDYTRAMRINPWWLIAAHKSVDAFFVKP